MFFVSWIGFKHDIISIVDTSCDWKFNFSSSSVQELVLENFIIRHSFLSKLLLISWLDYKRHIDRLDSIMLLKINCGCKRWMQNLVLLRIALIFENWEKCVTVQALILAISFFDLRLSNLVE